MNLKILKVTSDNLEVFKNLAQAYEAEFSVLTQKMPDEMGIFEIDVTPVSPYCGYLLMEQKIPIGFCVVDIQSDIKDVAEFYVIPAMRKKGVGYQMASMIFNKNLGHWRVRQIEGAVDAINFWRKTIKKITNGQYEESVMHDPYYGKVTCQNFFLMTDH